MVRESLTTLRNLVETLEDRDLGLKRDAALFESMFQNFPVPAAIWTADSEGHCTSRRVTDCKSQGWEMAPLCSDSVMSTYRCPELQRNLNEKMQEARRGEPVSFVCSSGETCIWTRLIPRFVGDRVVGVIGISLDVSSSFRMMTVLKSVQDVAGIDDETRERIDLAINSSYLKELLEGELK